MSDRLQEIRARLNALRRSDAETCRIADFYGLADPVSEACPRCEVHRHAENDIGYLLARIDLADFTRQVSEPYSGVSYWDEIGDADD